MANSTTAKVRNKKALLYVFVGLLFLASLGVGGYFFWKHRELKQQNRELSDKVSSVSKELEIFKTNPEQAAQAEVDRYVSEVGKLYDLPKEEKPSVATVKDKEKLKDQPFFAKAVNGDVTLIYTNAKLAILYRPSTKQIVNVSSVTIQDQQPAPPAR